MASKTRAAAADVAEATGTAWDKNSADPVTAILAKYDKNGDGVFQMDEVRGIVHDVMKTNQTNKMLKKFVGVLVLIIVATLVAMFGVSFAAGFALKDSTVTEAAQVSDTMPMMATDGSPVSVETTQSDLNFFALPALSAAELSALTTFQAYVDMSTGPIGSWVEYSAKLASVYKADDKKAMLETVTGHVLTVDASTKTASLLMNGNTYPVVVEKPDSMRRLASDVDSANYHPRRRARRGAFLRTSASFKMGKSSNRGGNT